jgi:hypothetical protein
MYRDLTLPLEVEAGAASLASVELAVLIVSHLAGVMLWATRRRSRLLQARSPVLTAISAAGILFTASGPARMLVGPARFSCGAMLISYFMVRRAGHCGAAKRAAPSQWCLAEPPCDAATLSLIVDGWAQMLAAGDCRL